MNLNRLGKRNNDTIHCPKFPKSKDEGWFLVLGTQSNGELLALKRIGYKNNKSLHQIVFNTSNKQERIIYTLYLMSDGYIGFDQQYDLQFEIIEPIIEPKELIIENQNTVNEITDEKFNENFYQQIVEKSKI